MSITCHNALIDNKPFFDQPVRNKQEEKLVEMSRNNDYTTGNLLDKLIGISLGQTNMNISQQINFVEKLEMDDGVTMFLLLKSSKKLF